MHNSCFRVINTDIQKLITNINDIPSPFIGKEFGVIQRDPVDFLNPVIYNLLVQLGSLQCLIFRMNPYADKRSIHIDIDTGTRNPFWPALNLIIKGQGVMRWFNPPGEGKIQFNPTAKVLYRYWDTDYGRPIDEWSDGKVALVRTDIPHQVWNDSDTERLAVSIRWSKPISWEETQKWFSNFFIPVLDNL
jgi:hypothetical protein